MGSRTSGWTGRNFPWCAWRIRTMRLSTGCPVQSKSGCGRSNSCEGPSMAIPALARDFKEFLKSLNSNRVEYLLIGGYAVGIYGHIRATNDQPQCRGVCQLTGAGDESADHGRSVARFTLSSDQRAARSRTLFRWKLRNAFWPVVNAPTLT